MLLLIALMLVAGFNLHWSMYLIAIFWWQICKGK